MKKIYRQWQLTICYMGADVITTSGEKDGIGYAWKGDAWAGVDDNPWN